MTAAIGTSNIKPETIMGFKNLIASIDGKKEQALGILEKITYKNKPSADDMPRLRELEKLLKGIRI